MRISVILLAVFSVVLVVGAASAYGFYIFETGAQSRLTATAQDLQETVYRLEKEKAAADNTNATLAKEKADLAAVQKQLSSERAKLQQTLNAQQQLLSVQGLLTQEQQKQIQAQTGTIGTLETTIGGITGQLQQLKKIGGEPLPKDFINSLLQATGRVRCLIAQSGGTAQYIAGSGSLLGHYPAVGNQYVVMTNGHVIADNAATGAPQCDIILGENSVFSADVVKRVQNETYDFAFLSLGAAKNIGNVIPASYEDLGIGFCEDADIELGDKITIVSYPKFQGPENAVSEGEITTIYDTNVGPIYEASAIIDNGSSGGLAILNKKKCAIGMPTWKGVGAKLGLSYIQSWPLLLSYKGINE